MRQPPAWLRIPSDRTLAKYGLSLEEYLEIAERQKYCCPICERRLEKTVHIEHLHIKGWSKYPAHIRKLFVRGLVCWFCNNYYLGRSITVEKARNVVKYLEAFEARRPK